MPQPWDRPSFPKRGNLSQRVLYASIGHALMNWEEIEGACAHLYSTLTKGHPYDTAANQEYGEPHNFIQRFTKLQKAMCDYTKIKPSQKREGEFDRLSKLILGFSKRRNDIAHGRARWMHWVITPDSRETILTVKERLQWCVIPPHFKGNKFTPDNRPTYVFSSREINTYAKQFMDVALQMSAFVGSIESEIRPAWQNTPTLLSDA